MNTGNKKIEDLSERVVAVKRVSKTVKGGKTFSVAVLVVVGDGKGNVGFGAGKAKETNDAKKKAVKQATNSLIKISLKEGRTLHHSTIGSFGAGKVIIRTAPSGTGIIAGDKVRAIFECLGVQDVVTKSLGSTNSYNIVAATFEALKKLSAPKHVAERRNKAISEIIRRRNIVIQSEG